MEDGDEKEAVVMQWERQVKREGLSLHHAAMFPASDCSSLPSSGKSSINFSCAREAFSLQERKEKGVEESLS